MTRAEVEALADQAVPVEVDVSALRSPLSLSSHSDGLMPPWPAPLAKEAWHGLAGEAVRTMEPHTEADPAALLLDLLVSFGSMVGRHAYFVADGAWHHFAVVMNRDGGSLVAKVGNLPAPGGGWLVSEIEATLTKPGGQTEVWWASLGYAPVGDRLFFEHISLKLTDAHGNLLRKKAKDVNPISYYFSNCRNLDAAPPAGD